MTFRSWCFYIFSKHKDLILLSIPFSKSLIKLASINILQLWSLGTPTAGFSSPFVSNPLAGFQLRRWKVSPVSQILSFFNAFGLKPWERLLENAKTSSLFPCLRAHGAWWHLCATPASQWGKISPWTSAWPMPIMLSDLTPYCRHHHFICEEVRFPL